MRKMRFIEVTPNFFSGANQYKPADDSDIDLFMRCCFGLFVATADALEKYRPVFAAHGIELVMP